MIGFMQKHKKYLMVIIWISTIAFIGAGFVGWGSYSFSSTSNAVAVVGDIKVSIDKMQREYARLYNIYNQLVGGTLDDEQAKKMGIEEQAINNLIVKALMLNYAYDLGLRVSKEEIIQEITSIEGFQNKGQFDEQIYKQTLKDNQLKPKDFEEGIEEGLLLQKLDALLNIPLTPLEIEALSAAYSMEDLVHIEVIDKKDVVFTPKEEEIKKYWENNKDIYQTQRGYEISSIFIPLDSIVVEENALEQYYKDFKNQFLDSNGQIIPFAQAKDKVIEKFRDSQAQKEALKEYISLRKGENQEAKDSAIYEGSDEYGADFINLLSQAKEQETLKPIRVNNKGKEGYITAKVVKIIPSQPQTYEVAKANAKEDYVNAEQIRLLEEKATKQLGAFKGMNIGYIGYGSEVELAGLTKEEASDFIRILTTKKEEKGYILLENKAILYQIFDQRVKNSAIIKENLDFLTQNGTQIKSRLVEIEFLNYLSKTYKVVRKI